MADVWFAKQEAPAPTAAELLSAPAADLLGGGSHTNMAAPAAAAGAAGAAAGGAGGLMSRGMVDDDLLRNAVPLI